jgi:hypothetical protein
MAVRIRYSAKTVYYFQKLANKVKIARNKSLYRTAAFIRSAAIRSLRVKDGPGKPGKPPHAHTLAGLRIIRFDVDPTAGSAVIGPEKFSGSRQFDEPVPHIHEFGGLFSSKKGYWRYPERSFMWYTTDRLIKSGKISNEFFITLARVL